MLRVRTSIGALVLFLGCELPLEPVEESKSRPRTRVPSPIQPVDEGMSANLLEQYAARQPILQSEADAWELPFQIKRLDIALVTIAAQDRLEDLDLVLTPDATWGMPETRRFGARPIFAGDGGEAFLAAFRKAAMRFPGNAKWETQPLASGPQDIIRNGAEPLWSFYSNANDRIYFRAVMYAGVARIDYVGLFEEVPTEPIKVIGHGKPAPLGPMLRHAPRGAGPTDPNADPDAPREEGLSPPRERPMDEVGP